MEGCIRPHLAKAYIVPNSEKVMVLVAEVYEIPTLRKQVHKFPLDLLSYKDLAYTVCRNTEVLLVGLYYQSHIVKVIGIDCATGAGEIYWVGNVEGRFVDSLPFVKCGVLYFLIERGLVLFDLTTRQFKEEVVLVELRLDETFTVGPLLSPGAYFIKKSPSCDVFIADEQGNATTGVLDSYEIYNETMIPLSSNEILVLDTCIGRLSRSYTVRCTSLFLCTLDPLDIDVLGDYLCLPGSIVSWVVVGRMVYTLRNTMIITRIDLANSTIKVLHYEQYYNSVKGFLFWLMAKKLPIKSVHMRMVLSMLKPADTEQVYGQITKAMQFF